MQHAANEHRNGFNMSEEEKKIIVDEDWKSQIETEKEEARKQEEGKKEEGEEKKEPAEAASAGPPQPLPPASFSFLCGSFYLQALIALGVVQDPISKEAEVNFDQAKHSIDLLAMLQEKTEGNRTGEEDAEIEKMLHELRMGFVAVQQQQEKEKTE
jgi:hypothetical protein